MSFSLLKSGRAYRSPGAALIAVFVSLLLVACGATSVSGDTPTASGPCSPADAPFAKVVNPATADEFSSCAIATEAEFLSPDWGVVVGGDVEGQVKFSLVVPGQSELKFAFIPKSKSDAIFALTKGDRVKVTGSTSKTMVGQVIFYATDVMKVEPKAAP